MRNFLKASLYKLAFLFVINCKTTSYYILTKAGITIAFSGTDHQLMNSPCSIELKQGTGLL